MNFNKIILIIFSPLLVLSSLLTQNVLVRASNESIDLMYTSKNVLISTPTSIAGVEIIGDGNDTIPIKLEVTNGTLSLSTTNGLTFSGPNANTGSVLYFSGLRSDINNALASLSYQSSSLGSDTLDISITEYGEVLYPENGHLYEYIAPSTGPVEWGTANALASSSTKYGSSGYLATVTSQGENNYINSRLLGAGWMGASDSVVEGDWKWITGPESGISFWSGDTNGNTVNGEYANWELPSQPDNFGGGENCAQFGTASNLTGYWNDLPCGGYWLQGYVVEYGSPGNLPVIPINSMTINTVSTLEDGDGVDPAIEDLAPNNGDANQDGQLDSEQSNVASFVNTVTSTYSVLVVDSDCNIVNVGSISQSSIQTIDNNYEYPLGLIDFSITCSNSGHTANITQYYFDIDNGLSYELRKYKANDGLYIPVTGASLQSQIISGQDSLVVMYQITDGDQLDDDGLVDGNIVDPAGPAVLVNSSTGTGVTQTTTTSNQVPNRETTLVNAGISTSVISLVGLILMILTIDNIKRTSKTNNKLNTNEELRRK